MTPNKSINADNLLRYSSQIHRYAGHYVGIPNIGIRSAI